MVQVLDAGAHVGGDEVGVAVPADALDASQALVVGPARALHGVAVPHAGAERAGALGRVELQVVAGVDGHQSRGAVEGAAGELAHAVPAAGADLDPGSEGAVGVERVGPQDAGGHLHGQQVLLPVTRQRRGDGQVGHTVPATGADLRRRVGGERAIGLPSGHHVAAHNAGTGRLRAGGLPCELPQRPGAGVHTDQVAATVAVDLPASQVGEGAPVAGRERAADDAPARPVVGNADAGGSRVVRPRVQVQVTGGVIHGHDVVGPVTGHISHGGGAGECEGVAAEPLLAPLRIGEHHSAVTVDAVVRIEPHVVQARPAGPEHPRVAGVEGVIRAGDGKGRTNGLDIRIRGRRRVVPGLRVERLPASPQGREARGDLRLLDLHSERGRVRPGALVFAVGDGDRPLVTAVPRDQPAGDDPVAAGLPARGGQLGAGGRQQLEVVGQPCARPVVRIVPRGEEFGRERRDSGIGQRLDRVDLRRDVRGGDPRAVLERHAVGVRQGRRAVEVQIPAQLVSPARGQRRNGPRHCD